jgi:MFS family permease
VVVLVVGDGPRLAGSLALISLSIGLVFNVLSEVFFGALSDRLGRRAVCGAGVILTIMWCLRSLRCSTRVNRC